MNSVGLFVKKCFVEDECNLFDKVNVEPNDDNDDDDVDLKENPATDAAFKSMNCSDCLILMITPSISKNQWKKCSECQ